jgi:hypothetical protein
MDRHYYLMIDTETAGDLDSPLVYDLGMQVIDKKGNVYAEYSLVISDVFYGMPALMNTAYYVEKLPSYYEEIDRGERVVVTWEYAQSLVKFLCDFYKIKAIVAHNARFDYTACNNTTSTIKGFKSYFFPYGIPIYCTLTMARQTVGRQKTYVEWCRNHGYITKNGAPRLTAEILYRYLSRNNDFIEKHTALEDVKIEKEIFVWIMRQHKAMRRTYYKERA